MTHDAATKAVIQDFAKQGKLLAGKSTEFPFVPSEQRTRAATAVNELHTAATDDLDPLFPVAELMHVLDARGEVSQVPWIPVLEALSEKVQAEIDKPGSSTTVTAVDPEVGILRAVTGAEAARQSIVGAMDTFKFSKDAYDAFRLAVLGDRGRAKSRAEWEVEIGALAAALRRPETLTPGVFLAFLPKLDTVLKDLKAARGQAGKSRVETIVWSLGVREAGYALALGLATLQTQTYIKATPARHGRMLRAIDPKRAADSTKAAGKGKSGTEPGAGTGGTAGAGAGETPAVNPGAAPGSTGGAKAAPESPPPKPTGA